MENTANRRDLMGWLSAKTIGFQQEEGHPWRLDRSFV